MRTGNRLHEEEVVQLKPQRMRAPVAGFQKPDGVIELQSLPRQKAQLRDYPEVKKNKDDRRQLEELRDGNVDTEYRQRYRRFQQEVGVGDARDRNGQIRHDAEEDQPGDMRR